MNVYIPPGAAALTPYVCPRQCADAIAWYTEVFGAQEVGERYVDPDGRVGHASVHIGGMELMLSDAYPDYGTVAPEPGNAAATYALQVYVPDVDATVQAADAAGATVQRAPEDQFYGSRLATLVDPFGVRWMVATHLRDVSADELAAAASEFSVTGSAPGSLE